MKLKLKRHLILNSSTNFIKCSKNSTLIEQYVRSPIPETVVATTILQ